MSADYSSDGNFHGHSPRECSEHRTVGSHRAWCFDCREWCYPGDPCVRCRPQPPDAATVREELAAIEHERWAHWQQYLHSKCDRREDGSLIIPAGYVAALERQIETPYAGLTEREKDSDREQVDRYWHVLAVCGIVEGEAQQ